MAKSHMMLDRSLVSSKAWLSLKGKATKVYLLFRLRCRYSKTGSGKYKQWTITNNGDITFGYREAQQRYGIKDKAFTRAIDELIEKGFLDITESGMGAARIHSKYAISERWKLYGTTEFVHRERPSKGVRRNGFQPGNEYGFRKKQPLQTTDTQPS